MPRLFSSLVERSAAPLPRVALCGVARGVKLSGADVCAATLGLGASVSPTAPSRSRRLWCGSGRPGSPCPRIHAWRVCGNVRRISVRESIYDMIHVCFDVTDVT